MLVAAVVALAVGTFAFRLSGVLLADRVALPRWLRDTLPAVAAILLASLAVTAALTEGGAFAGWARPAGVLVGLGLAVRRAPLVVVVLAAATSTAGLRLLGVA